MRRGFQLLIRYSPDPACEHKDKGDTQNSMKPWFLSEDHSFTMPFRNVVSSEAFLADLILLP